MPSFVDSPCSGVQTCPWSFLCLNASKCHHLGQMQSQSMRTVCPLEVFLNAELPVHTNSSPVHNLVSFCFLNCPTLTPAKSQLETQGELFPYPCSSSPCFLLFGPQGPSPDPMYRKRVIYSCNSQSVSLGLQCSVIWKSVRKTKSQAPT